MSHADEPMLHSYPLPSPAQLGDHVREVRRRADEAEDPIAEIMATAERAIARFRVLPCEGARENLACCTESVERDCPERPSPGCPRNVIAYEQQERARIDEERLVSTGMPKRIAAIASGKLRETKSLTVVRQWLPSDKRTLLLAGTAGVGKSIAAAHALVISRGLWVAAADLARIAIEDKPRYAALRETPLLVVDDLGTDAPDKSGWSAAQVQALLCLRDDAGLRTLATTNLRAEAFRKVYDERVWDRFSAGLMASDGGKSLRGDA